MNSNILLYIIVITVAAISAFIAVYQIYVSFKQIKETQASISKAESKVEAQPERISYAWELARVKLESYFNRNLSQITYIFWLSVSVMIIGFAIIVWGIYQSTKSPNILAPAAIATIAGIITEFIGATFLFIYRSTIQQAIRYSQTLERINAVGMAWQILDTMPDEAKSSDIKNKTKAVLVELLVRQAYNGIEIGDSNESQEK
jgi:NADH:ubiquinone oxidoreductase subunit K